MIDRPETPHADVLLEGIWEDEVTPDDLASRALSAAQASSYAFRVASEGTTATAQLGEVDVADFLESETGTWAQNFIGIVRVGESLVHVSHALGELARNLQQVNLEQSEIVYQVEADIEVAQRQSAIAGVDPAAKIAELLAVARARAAEVAEKMPTPETNSSKPKPAVGLVSGFMAFGRVPGAVDEAAQAESGSRRSTRNGQARNGYAVHTRTEQNGHVNGVNGHAVNGTNGHAVNGDEHAVNGTNGHVVNGINGHQVNGANGHDVVEHEVIEHEVNGHDTVEPAAPERDAAAAALDAFADSGDETAMDVGFLGFGRTPSSPVVYDVPSAPVGAESEDAAVEVVEVVEEIEEIETEAEVEEVVAEAAEVDVAPLEPVNGFIGLGRTPSVPIPSDDALVPVVAEPLVNGFMAFGRTPAINPMTAEVPAGPSSGPIPIAPQAQFIPVTVEVPEPVVAQVVEDVPVVLEVGAEPASPVADEASAEAMDDGFLSFGRVPGASTWAGAGVVPTVPVPAEPIEADQPGEVDPDGADVLIEADLDDDADAESTEAEVAEDVVAEADEAEVDAEAEADTDSEGETDSEDTVLEDTHADAADDAELEEADVEEADADTDPEAEVDTGESNVEAERDDAEADASDDVIDDDVDEDADVDAAEADAEDTEEDVAEADDVDSEETPADESADDLEEADVEEADAAGDVIEDDLDEDADVDTAEADAEDTEDDGADADTVDADADADADDDEADEVEADEVDADDLTADEADADDEADSGDAAESEVESTVEPEPEPEPVPVLVPQLKGKARAVKFSDLLKATAKAEGLAPVPPVVPVASAFAAESTETTESTDTAESAEPSGPADQVAGGETPAAPPAPAKAPPVLATGPVILGRAEPLVLPQRMAPAVQQVHDAVASILGSLRNTPHAPDSGFHWAAGLLVSEAESIMAVATSDAGWLPPGVVIPAGMRVLWNSPTAHRWAAVDDPVRQLVEYAAQDGYELTAVATTHPSRAYAEAIGAENMVRVTRPGVVFPGGRSRFEATVSPARLQHIRSLTTEQADRQARALIRDLESVQIAPEHAIGIEAARLDARCFLDDTGEVPPPVLQQLLVDERALSDALRLDRTPATADDLFQEAPRDDRLRDRIVERAVLVAVLAGAHHDIESAVYAWTYARFLASQDQDATQER